MQGVRRRFFAPCLGVDGRMRDPMKAMDKVRVRDVLALQQLQDPRAARASDHARQPRPSRKPARPGGGGGLRAADASAARKMLSTPIGDQCWAGCWADMVILSK